MPLLVDDYTSSERVLAMDAHEERAYFRLIIAAWRGGGSIPDDDRFLAEASRAGARWPKVKPRVMECFELREDGRWYQPKVCEMIAQAEEISEKRRSSADKRWGAKQLHKQCKTDANASANASANTLEMQCHTQSHTHTQENTPPCSPPSEDGERSRHEPAPDGWEAFWAEYPRKDGKRAAFKAFCKLRAGPLLLAAMLTALNEQKASKRWRESNGEFIPHASTWLNGRRWEDRGVEGLKTVPGRLGYGNTANDRTQRNLANAEAALRIIRSRGSPDGDRIG